MAELKTWHGCAEPVKLAVTEHIGFVPKKPNLHLMEDDSKESSVYNFHFPSDAEGSESFDRILHVLQCVTSGAAHSLVPLVQIVRTTEFCLVGHSDMSISSLGRITS